MPTSITQTEKASIFTTELRPPETVAIMMTTQEITVIKSRSKPVVAFRITPMARS